MARKPKELLVRIHPSLGMRVELGKLRKALTGRRQDSSVPRSVALEEMQSRLDSISQERDEAREEAWTWEESYHRVNGSSAELQVLLEAERKERQLAELANSEAQALLRAAQQEADHLRSNNRMLGEHIREVAKAHHVGSLHEAPRALLEGIDRKLAQLKDGSASCLVGELATAQSNHRHWKHCAEREADRAQQALADLEKLQDKILTAAQAANIIPREHGHMGMLEALKLRAKSGSDAREQRDFWAKRCESLQDHILKECEKHGIQTKHRTPWQQVSALVAAYHPEADIRSGDTWEQSFARLKTCIHKQAQALAIDTSGTCRAIVERIALKADQAEKARARMESRAGTLEIAVRNAIKAVDSGWFHQVRTPLHNALEETGLSNLAPLRRAEPQPHAQIAQILAAGIRKALKKLGPNYVASDYTKLQEIREILHQTLEVADMKPCEDYLPDGVYRKVHDAWDALERAECFTSASAAVPHIRRALGNLEAIMGMKRKQGKES